MVFLIIGELMEVFIAEHSMINVFMLIVLFNGIIFTRVKLSSFKVVVIVT
jgi:hypothetical protein